MTDMQHIEELVHQLRSPNSKEAYTALKSLEETSASSNAVYVYIDTFIEMIRDSNSYVRTRGLVLIACNAKWDEEEKIEGILEEYLSHVTDEKPITARQCVKSLAVIGEAKPNLAPVIIASLRNADLSQYPDTMRPLVQKDIADVLLALEQE